VRAPHAGNSSSHKGFLGVDSHWRWPHAELVKRLVASVTLAVVACAAAALGDAIQKWQTPDGALYFGDRPPKGSTLVETYADTPVPPATAVSSDQAALSQAAADGRDIIRRREAVREAERQADAARELRMAQIEASQIDGYDSAPFWFITGGFVPCRFGEPCGHDIRFFRRDVSDNIRHPFFLKNRFFPSNAFFPRRRFFPGHQFFRNDHLLPRTPTQFRFGPAPAPRRSPQMSARFGR